MFSPTLSSKSLIWSSVSSNLLFIPSSVLFISDIALCIAGWFFFIFSVFFHAIGNPYNHNSKLSIWSISFASISFSSPSGEFSCSFVLGLFLCLPSLAAPLYLFPCIREICTDSGSDQCQDTACDLPWVTCLELLSSLWLPLFGLGVCRKNCAEHQGWLLLYQDHRECQLKSQRSQRAIFSVKLSHWDSFQL